LISDDYALSGTKSVNVVADNDLILIMDDYYTGCYAFEFNMYVPTGYCGYFNLQKTSVPGTEWGFQAYYQTDGTVVVDAHLYIQPR